MKEETNYDFAGLFENHHDDAGVSNKELEDHTKRGDDERVPPQRGSASHNDGKYKIVHIKSFVKKNGTVVKAHDKKIRKKRKILNANKEVDNLAEALSSLKYE